MGYELITVDVMEWCKSYDGPKFHAMLCDPPYHLIQQSRNGSARQPGTGPYGRHREGNVETKGFMGKTWDGGDIAFQPDTWAALAEHLYPGAFGMAFASSRGWHRLACAIEDAGLVIHPSIFIWAYGSGFPKATRIDTQIDKEAGIEQEVIGKRSNGASNKSGETIFSDDAYSWSKEVDITIPATPLAQTWASHRYGLQALKPAAEPIIVFQKPYSGKSVQCITETGAGALNIEGGRIGVESIPSNRWKDSMHPFGNGAGNEYETVHNQGRWPANFLLQHTPMCEYVGTKRVESDGHHSTGHVNTGACYGKFTSMLLDEGNKYADSDGLETVSDWKCVPECPVRRLGEQSGELKPGYTLGGGTTPIYGSGDNITYRASSTMDTNKTRGFTDTGTASRFFFQSDWAAEIEEQLNVADPVRYCAKASRREREAGLDGMEEAPTPHHPNEHRRCALCGKSAGGQLTNCHCTNPQWASMTDSKLPVCNCHPTVKPLALTHYLATLLLPPSAYAPRRILIPFAGVASEMIGALQSGWEDIIGLEMEAEYTEIGRARLDYWHTRPEQRKLL